METRKCCKCQKQKAPTEFHKKTETTFHSYCKSCLYETQKERWKNRKLEAIKHMGGKCSLCSYDKCYAALEFHHIDASQKEFDWNSMRLMSWDKSNS